ncbi:hypothetical protein XOC_0970 [Xanthomonas oryzae pv. oryzicola BLS256]|uniref:Uncharacterized protein n=1 Tax=Xanthomonas oryzae pv. oryzicola (strain BLS256) TaxID=383407 RepID=G7TEJ7_XANOB|nr:hypothetical protein XOC_0970 [Xanthomonas oryzae pv. oryzicola BLS256]QEO98953.1 hypothetical protein XOCgx_3966 [Xanthomonas oryzae pv. oryzicola]
MSAQPACAADRAHVSSWQARFAPEGVVGTNGVRAALC